MKNYICLNSIECTWADEKPPREFALPNGDENVCPNCGSTTIREVVPISPPWKRAIPFVLGGMVALGLLLYFIFRDENPIKKTDTKQVREINKTDSTDSTNKTTDKKHTNVERQVTRKESPKHTPITYKKVEGSEFCISDCVLGYSEIDNLGRIIERRVENYVKCCPANK